MSKGTPGPAGKLSGVLLKIEEWALALILGAMILFSVLRIAQRNIIGSSIHWTDELLQVLVLWIGLFGAMAASREPAHISIDLAARLLPGRISAASKAFAALFAAVVSAIAAWAGYHFMATEMEFGARLFGGKLPSWAVQWAVPFAFGVMALRFSGHFVKNLIEAAGKGKG